MRITLVIALIISTLSVFSQDQLKSLNEDLKRSQKEIERLDGELSQNRRLQMDKLTQKKLLDAKVLQRGKLVSQFNDKISALKNDMGDLSGVVVRHNKRLDSIIGVRNRLYRNAYKVLSISKLAEKVERQSFYKREILLVTSMFNSEAHNVDSMRRIMGQRYDRLMEQSRELAELSMERKAELALLEVEKRQIELLNLQLKKDESVIKQSADSERLKMQQLQNQIANMVRTEAKTSSVGALGGEFGQNKGRLPAPLLAYLVEDKFGVHDHPTKKGIKVQNNGVNLRATIDLSVMAVFDGEVRGVFLLDGMGSSVLVRHGTYFTVYSNLDRVKVAKGQSIKAGQQVGQLGDRNSILHFEVWNGTTNLDPLIWLKSR